MGDVREIELLGYLELGQISQMMGTVLCKTVLQILAENSGVPRDPLTLVQQAKNLWVPMTTLRFSNLLKRLLELTRSSILRIIVL